MSSPPTNSSPPLQVPHRRRRGLMACTVCRARKARCITSEQPPVSPCDYCKRKRLQCEYVSISEQDSGTPPPPRGSGGHGGHSGTHPPFSNQSWAPGASQNFHAPPGGSAHAYAAPQGNYPPNANAYPPAQGHYPPNSGAPMGYGGHPGYGPSNTQYANVPHAAQGQPQMHAAYHGHHPPTQPSAQQGYPPSSSSGNHGYDAQMAHAAQYLASRGHGRPSGPPAAGGYSPSLTDADYNEWIADPNSNSRSSPYGG
ncbi:hypothetical protein C8R46DRAFT_1137366 [Mycena filopes]|nr:hypothetical protein C8R46DRAFT_1137366 [Mycena filopes]